VVEAIRREVQAGSSRTELLVKRGSGLDVHASRSINRDSIARHGLDWRRMTGRGIVGNEQPERPGVFVCADLERAQYSGPFDEAFRTAGIRIVKTPVRAPKANAIAERFVRTVRGECLDWLLILNRRHLERVLRVYVEHYNTHSPHRVLRLQPPQPREPPPSATVGAIERHDSLGGLIHEYYRHAA
jgi:putative transposase